MHCAIFAETAHVYEVSSEEQGQNGIREMEKRLHSAYLFFLAQTSSQVVLLTPCIPCSKVWHSTLANIDRSRNA